MESQASPSDDKLILGIIAGAAAGVLGIGVWTGCYKIGASGFAIVGWLSGPLIGVMVGLAIRHAGRSRQTPAAIAAIIITLLSCAIGYIVTDMVLFPWDPPSDLPQAIRNLGKDIQAWLLIAIGCYISFALARKA